MTRAPADSTARPDLAAVVEALGVRSRVYCRVYATSPWGMEGGPDDVATFHAILSGRGWLRVHGVPGGRWLDPGDVVVMPHGSRHAISDRPESPVVPFARVIREFPLVEGRLELGGGGEPTRVLCGAFHASARDAPPMLGLLPPLLVARVAHHLLEALATEHLEQREGWEAAVQWIAPALFLQVLRSWLSVADPLDAHAVGALADPRIARVALRIHGDPGAEWTVERLASVAAMSRTVFATRFTALLGQPPLRYVAAVRLQAAAHALRRGDDGLAQIAADCGYQAEEAFSRAFKRRFGTSPGAWRRQAEPGVALDEAG
jgi:AraC-like DNA-binding protein